MGSPLSEIRSSISVASSPGPLILSSPMLHAACNIKKLGGGWLHVSICVAGIRLASFPGPIPRFLTIKIREPGNEATCVDPLLHVQCTLHMYILLTVAMVHLGIEISRFTVLTA